MTDVVGSLASLTGLEIYPQSLVDADDGVRYFLGRRDESKWVGSIGEGAVSGKIVGELDGASVVLGQCDESNALAMRIGLPWTAPTCLGLATSAGLGDRLGLATPGHIRAVRTRGGAVRPILAQQSIREMIRTRRTPREVMDAATWGVLQEGYRDGFGSDADHLQNPEDIEATAEAGFTMFTIDPGRHVVDDADTMDGSRLAERFEQLDYETLNLSRLDLKRLYEGKSFSLVGGGKVSLEGLSFARAAVKYGNAIAHTARMYRHLHKVAGGDFDLEVSVDETASPTTPAEHFYFASELRRLGVRWVSLAPRFLGRMEKGVDYIGDLDEFRRSFAGHIGVMRTLGPYKISIHSGSDKFSIYPIIAEMTTGCVHLKTAGTSYLEAVRAIGKIDPDLFREIYAFARGRYETDKASYHVSADLTKTPPPEQVPDEQLTALLDDFDARQVFHVTFGSVLTAEDGERFRSRMIAELLGDEQTHYDMLAAHLGRHLEPFAMYAGSGSR